MTEKRQRQSRVDETIEAPADTHIPSPAAAAPGARYEGLPTEEPASDQPIAEADGDETTSEASDPEPEEPRDELEEARAQASAYLDDLKRLKAEFENYRKRVIKEQTAMIERASSAVVERLLPILDNFQLALLAADRTKDYEAMVRGVELVYGELLEVLKKEGLERIDSLHKPFDPELHEAVMRAEGDGDELVVVDEMRPGYRLSGRVVRPAMVKVGPKQ